MKPVDDIQRFRANLIDELNGAALYKHSLRPSATPTGATSSCTRRSRSAACAFLARQADRRRRDRCAVLADVAHRAC
jgi:hypothetical protein